MPRRTTAINGPRPDRPRSFSLFADRALDGPAAGQQLEDQDDQREDEQDVDERADRRERDDAEQPKDQQHDNDRPEHDYTSLRERDSQGACHRYYPADRQLIPASPI